MFGWPVSNVTRRLTQASYALRVKRSGPFLAMTAGVVLVGIGAAFAVQKHDVSPELALRRQVQNLQDENRRMRDALEQGRLKMEHDAAARQELEKQLAETKAELNRFRDELAFFRAQQRARPSR